MKTVYPKRPVFVLSALAVFIMGAGSIAVTQETDPTRDTAAKAPQMKEYFVVMLGHGPNRNQPDSVARELQTGHLANIEHLAKLGKAIIAGPFGDGRGGMIIMTNTTKEEAERLVAEDPMVKVGRLTAEVRSWWAAEGILPEPETE